MTFDHARSSRLGQRVAPEAPGAFVAADKAHMPQSPYHGQLCWRKDVNGLFIYVGSKWFNTSQHTEMGECNLHGDGVLRAAGQGTIIPPELHTGTMARTGSGTLTISGSLSGLGSGQLWSGHIPKRVILSVAGSANQVPTYDDGLVIIDPVTPQKASYGHRIFDDATAWASNTALTNSVNGMLSTCDDEGVMAWISVKVTGTDWAGVAAGNYDTRLDAIIALSNARKAAHKTPWIFAIHHEPAGDAPTGQSTTDWSNMQTYCSNYFAGINDFMCFSAIGNGFYWNSNTTTNNNGKAATFPQTLINALRINKGLAAVDCYDDHDTYTGQNSTTFNPGSSGTAQKLQAWITWMKARNCGALGMGEYSTLTGGGSTSPGIEGLREAWAVMRANRDVFTIANYYNSVSGGSTWDWRLVGANYPRTVPPNPSAIDFGGTTLTADRLAYYRTMLDESISATYTS